MMVPSNGTAAARIPLSTHSYMYLPTVPTTDH